jgi:hypothetical protein
MKDLIRKLLRESEDEKAFTKKEALFFKFLNTFKKAAKSKFTDSKLSDVIYSNLKSFGLDLSDYHYYWDLYTQNYREDGRYDLTTKGELNSYHSMKPKRTANSSASDYVKQLKPFKGSNLSAEWKKDFKGDWAYVVYSWNWYPIYLFKYRKWFQVDDKYSSSTSKHISQSNPSRYNPNLDKVMIIVSPQEIRSLLHGEESTEKIISKKNEKFINTIENQFNEYKQVRLGWDPRLRISFNFTNVEFVDEHPVVDLDIVHVDKMNGLKIDREAGDFMTGQMVGVTREYVSNLMKEHISNYSSFLLGRDVSKDIVVNVNF